MSKVYIKKQQGKIKNFTGVDAPYEAPENPDLLVDTNKNSIKKTVGFLYNQIIETIILILKLIILQSIAVR